MNQKEKGEKGARMSGGNYIEYVIPERSQY